VSFKIDGKKEKKPPQKIGNRRAKKEQYSIQKNPKNERVIFAFSLLSSYKKIAHCYSKKCAQFAEENNVLAD
jgi:recombinational DNA repair protein RecR